MSNQHFTDELVSVIEQDSTLNENAKNIIFRNLAKLKDTKVNILITGATGCGKSSTINALFDIEKAKVGQGVDPETMDIQKYELNNIILFDSPGLGDGKEADIIHSQKIIEKLHEKDSDGDLLIDLVLVILDGCSKDLGTSAGLINDVIIPNLGTDQKRLLVAINQADMAMKGNHWDKENCKPKQQLVEFLEAKVKSTRERIKKDTGVDVEPIYYVAGYKADDEKQQPYNLSKLMLHILRHTKQEKRAVFAQDMNKDKDVWENDDKREDYRSEIQETMWESVKSSAAKGADVGENIGAVLGGPAGRAAGRAVGTVVGAAAGFMKRLLSW